MPTLPGSQDSSKNPYLPETAASIGPRPGEGFDIPDPFGGESPMPPKTTQPKPLISSPDIIPPTPLAPPVFQQMAPQKQEGRRWVLVTLGAFIAVLLIGVIVFIAIRLLSQSGSQVPIPSFSPVATTAPASATPTVAPTEAPAAPTSTPTPILAPGGADDVADPDSDNLTNAEERFYGTESTNADTDGDGYSDGDEITHGHNPLIPAPNDAL